MASGPEHYKEAERLVGRFANAEALVHATLAAAAATIDAAYGDLAENSREAWSEARSDNG
jgi:hypothetical protein